MLSVLVLGTGYIAQAFAVAVGRRDMTYCLLSRAEADYTSFRVLRRVLAELRPELLINAAGFVGKPNVDQCENHKELSLMANVVFVETVANACEATGTPWAQVCSGCVYQGFKDSSARTGWTENDTPNFSFDAGPCCSWYSGCKAASERIVVDAGAYGWRLRIPFDEIDHPRNYLTKIQRYDKLLDVPNSLSHRGEFAAACLDLWDRRAERGLYNVTNGGYITTREVVEIVQRTIGLRQPDFFADENEMYASGCATARRSSCVLDNGKLLATGVAMRPVAEAIEDASSHWQADRSCLEC